MSVVSSRVSSVSSILKSPGVRSQLIRQSNRVCFKLPKNLKNIICSFVAGDGTADYDDLICILRDTAVKDDDLLEFLTEIRQCVSLLGPEHKVFIETILQLKWTDRSAEVITAYKLFVEDLICMQIYHTKSVIDSLVEQFKPAETDVTEWEAGQCKAEDEERLKRIHDILQKILNVVPLSSKILLQSVRARFPYMVHGTHTHEVYVYALLQIVDYAPHLRSDILSLIINRLMAMDVSIPRPNPEEDEDYDMLSDGNESNGVDSTDAAVENNEQNKSALHPIAHTLDVCMELVLSYMYNCCFKKELLDIESLKSLYITLLQTFETVILSTHASQYVQYVMFYICSFKVAIAEAFVDWLWRKTSDPNVPSVTRQSSISYIASLLATAAFVSPGLVKTMQLKMSRWIHNYIAMQEYSETNDYSTKEHSVFYSVCQALFLTITTRHRDFRDLKNNLSYLRELDLPKIVTCKLNPLKVCLPEIVHDFADITRTYQLAYCYTIIENNTRNQLPVVQSSNNLPMRYDSFFPFSAYDLQRSGRRITPLFYESTAHVKHKPPSENYNQDGIEFMTD